MKTLSENIQEWMVKHKQRSVKPSTFDRLVTSLVLMKHYRIARITIDRLTMEDIQDYINALTDDGYALSTIKKQYHLLSEFIDYANTSKEFMQYLPAPIYKGANLPARSIVKKKEKRPIAYNRQQQSRLRCALLNRDCPSCRAAILMMETGMRVGEVLALTWDDINWNNRSVFIHKTVVHLGNSKRQFVQGEAKSYTSNRPVPLSKTAYELLESMLNDGCDPDGYVFHSDNGSLLTYESMRYNVSRACADANVPYYGQHVFRHTFATNCYNRGCDVKILSKLLGHSDVSITYNVYIHLYGDALEEMRKVVE